MHVRSLVCSIVFISLLPGSGSLFAQQPVVSPDPAAAQAPLPASSTPADPTAPTQSGPVHPASGTTVPAATTAKPGKPGKALKPPKKKKEKPPKMHPMPVVQATLTVDGMVGKARLNYDIPDLKFVYLWAPGVGTLVVSDNKFPLAKEEPNAFSGNDLTVDANGHTVQLASEKRLLGKKPSSAWVYVDTAYQNPSRFPVMGYGSTALAPYAWPGAKVVAPSAGVVVPPPLPNSLRPVTGTAPCVPAGSKARGAPCPASTPPPPPA